MFFNLSAGDDTLGDNGLCRRDNFDTKFSLLERQIGSDGQEYTTQIFPLYVEWIGQEWNVSQIYTRLQPKAAQIGRKQQTIILQLLKSRCNSRTKIPPRPHPSQDAGDAALAECVEFCDRPSGFRLKCGESLLGLGNLRLSGGLGLLVECLLCLQLVLELMQVVFLLGPDSLGFSQLVPELL